MELEELNAVRIFAMQTVIGALIKTHPNPAAFAAVLEQGMGLVQVEQIRMSFASAEARKEAVEFAQDFVHIAKDEAQARAQRGQAPG